jgi:cytochrome c oxidase cbb3-type subunit 3
MPAIPLNEKQIADVVAYLHALVEVSDRTSAGRPARDYSLKRLLTGNAEAGRAYFNGVGNCASCHSVTGDLAGIARRYAPVELQARFLYPAAKTTNAKVTLHSGEVVSGTLIHQDDFYVAVEDKSGWYHSWSARDVKVDLEDPLKAHKELLSRYSQADMHNVFAYLETLQ